MTLSLPSFLAAATRASMPPRSAAEVALLASVVLPPVPAEPEVGAAAPVVAPATVLVAAPLVPAAAVPDPELLPHPLASNPRVIRPVVSETALVRTDFTVLPFNVCD